MCQETSLLQDAVTSYEWISASGRLALGSLEVQVGLASVESKNNNDVTQLINRQLIDAPCSPPPSTTIIGYQQSQACLQC